jgi:hypothetical protein
MKKRIVNFSALQSAKTLAALYFVISLPFMALFAFMPGKSAVMMIVFPVVYTVSGFVFTLIAAWIYNLVAGWTGGIEYTSEEVVE